MARLIADVLAEDGHRAEVVLDSREALAMIGRRDYGLVICDLRMPYLGGRGLFQELLRRGHPSRPRFVFVTGDVQSPHVAEFLRTNGAPYLAKPFLIDDLKNVVYRALSQADAPASAGASRAGQKGRRDH